MPKAAPPKTPFSTPLSGSAREAEERIRSIFQYKKKRPPLLFFALACSLALLCGGLVSCQSASDTSGDGSPNAGPGIAMALQYYDTHLNYIEVPTLVPPEGEELDQAAASINQELAELAREAFALPEEDLRQLGQATEAFLMTQQERGFRTLDYYKRLPR